MSEDSHTDIACMVRNLAGTVSAMQDDIRFLKHAADKILGQMAANESAATRPPQTPQVLPKPALEPLVQDSVKPKKQLTITKKVGRCRDGTYSLVTTYQDPGREVTLCAAEDSVIRKGGNIIQARIVPKQVKQLKEIHFPYNVPCIRTEPLVRGTLVFQKDNIVNYEKPMPINVAVTDFEDIPISEATPIAVVTTDEHTWHHTEPISPYYAALLDLPVNHD